ncbi:unnamed protein product [Aphanomyces euteiches]|uniref:Uncharacterized protein n=1 Tax=Aphanomyces euteiches TaxID=100861 RepID=A0A6G0WHB5_9STRA|nr:hypothetical protein Ae201684_015181 [Aphanomyces euteiches]KAH9080013.1 hypothetical protein Ae201684P_020592 [Aphanomyces euteiches]KAH9133600.1 hypothetical protein AeRB84_020381 [Aphanomyces euteiches]
MATITSTTTPSTTTTPVQDEKQHIRVRKWRQERKLIGPGGHLEILTWTPEVPVPTKALQESQHVDVKTSTAIKKAQINTRKRAAPSDGSAARMTRSLRHNTTNSTELWGQLPPVTLTRPVVKKETTIKPDPADTSATTSDPPSVTHAEASVVAESAEDTKASSENGFECTAASLPGNETTTSTAATALLDFDDDDDDDEGYISPLSSGTDVGSPSPSPVASPDS